MGPGADGLQRAQVRPVRRAAPALSAPPGSGGRLQEEKCSISCLQSKFLPHTFRVSRWLGPSLHRRGPATAPAGRPSPPPPHLLACLLLFSPSPPFSLFFKQGAPSPLCSPPSLLSVSLLASPGSTLNHPPTHLLLLLSAQPPFQ